MSSSTSGYGTLAWSFQIVIFFLNLSIAATSPDTWAHGQPSKRQKLDAPGRPSNPEVVVQNFQTEDGPSQIDEQILKEYEWAPYRKLSPTMRDALEKALLNNIILQLSPTLTVEEATKACSRLLQDKTLHTSLLRCWEEGSFERLRSHGMPLCKKTFFISTNILDREDLCFGHGSGISHCWWSIIFDFMEREQDITSR
jgi:hypothetical protein